MLEGQVAKLTKRSVESAKLPEVKVPKDRRRWSWLGDSEVPGFGVRLYGSGRRVFALRYRTRKGGRHRMLTLGTFGELTVQKARDMAREEKVRVLKGEDPQAEKKKVAKADGVRTVGELMKWWLDNYAMKVRRGWKEDERRIDRRIVPKLGRVRLRDLNVDALDRFHEGIAKTAPVEANRCVQTLRSAWRKAVEKEKLPGDLIPPAWSNVDLEKENSRDRWVRPLELNRLMAAVEKEEDPYVRAAIRLFLLTGLRKRELLSAKWEDVDLQEGEIRLPNPKSGEPQTRLLVSSAVQILRELPRMAESPYVFPGRNPSRPRGDIKKPWIRIREDSGLRDVTLHDLRRTCGSYLAQAGVPLDTIAGILGHKDEKVTRIYAQLSKQDERRALEALEGRLSGALGLAPVKKAPDALPDRLRALLEDVGNDPDALADALRGLVDWDRAVDA